MQGTNQVCAVINHKTLHHQTATQHWVTFILRVLPHMGYCEALLMSLCIVVGDPQIKEIDTQVEKANT